MISFVPGQEYELGEVEPPGGTNAAPLDSWTLVHAATGAAAAALGIPFWAYALLATGYEVAEYAHEWPRGSRLFGSKRPESGANIAADLVVGAAAWWLVSNLR